MLDAVLFSILIVFCYLINITVTRFSRILISNRLTMFQKIEIAKISLMINKAFPVNGVLDAVLCSFMTLFRSLIDITATPFDAILLGKKHCLI